MPEILVTPPTGEPLDLADVKTHLRVTDTSQDVLIAAMLSGARQAAETKTRQQLLYARYRLVIDKFPMAGVGTLYPFEHVVNMPAYGIILPHAPVVDIVSIQYLDMSGTLQTVDPSVYTANLALMPSIITPRFGQIWPIPLPQIGAVTVTYDAGYAAMMTVVNAGAGTFSISGPVTHAVGDLVQFYNSGGALPGGLVAKANYTIASANAGVYTVNNAAGSPVTFSDSGSGTNYCGVVPEGIRNWILIRVGSLYENREEVAILNRGKVEELPFIDGLLDPYRISLP
ncbi:head-tail connector protein [Ralstonia sp. 25C]|uniref:head-tail connector protein n=1 Tax=Ralstonia sp. 25C TaxID=3447363 RepID=UPI003F75265E